MRPLPQSALHACFCGFFPSPSLREWQSNEDAMKNPKASQKNGHGSPEVPKFKMFDMKEIAAVLEVSLQFVTAAKKAGAPFYEGKTRPKWVKKWLKRKAHEDGRNKSLEP